MDKSIYIEFSKGRERNRNKEAVNFWIGNSEFVNNHAGKITVL